MAIYEAKLFMTYFGQKCLNRWNYVSQGVPGAVQGSFGLAFALGFANVAQAGTVYRTIRAALGVAVTFDGYEVSNLYDPEDFYTGPLVSQTGDATGEGMPPYVAYGFRTNRVTTEIRRATKRFVGVVETQSVAGGSVAGAFQTANLQPIATAMSAILVYDDEGNQISYSPAVLSREQYAPSPGKVAYRKYGTEVAQLAHTAVGVVWEPYNTMRSQVSRQYGRGV